MDKIIFELTLKYTQMGYSLLEARQKAYLRARWLQDTDSKNVAYNKVYKG